MTTMNDLIMKLVHDYNACSELVALNYEQLKEGTLEDSVLQWNRGGLSCIEDYLSRLAASVGGVRLEWECGTHAFDYGDANRARQLEYRTVRAVFAPVEGGLTMTTRERLTALIMGMTEEEAAFVLAYLLHQAARGEA